MKNVDVEWELSNEAREVNTVGSPPIDLFFTRATNAKCSKYLSSYRDPYAESIDVLTVDWSDYKLFYACPPFCLILKVIERIIKTDKATGILVFPI